MRPSPRLSLQLFAALLAIVLATGLLAQAVPETWLGPRTDTIVAHQSHFTDRFFPWDARWYQRAATEGYQWSRAQPGEQQAVAFFPFWPALLRILALTGLPVAAAAWLAIAAAAAFAWASIYAMHRLAARLLPPAAAGTATILYSLYPGAGFLLKSYPTGAQNLLALLCLTALADRLPLLAALCAGAATACGPLGVALSLTVTISALWPMLAARTASEAVRILATAAARGALSAAGLIGFMLFQWVTLGTPTAFMQAQWAWHPAADLASRLVRSLFMLLALPDLVLAAARLPAVLPLWTAGAHAEAQAHVQNALNTAALGTALLATFAAALPALRRLLPWQVLLQGAALLLLYIWFVASVIDGWATLRLIYPAIVPFLVAAAALQCRPAARRLWLTASCLLLVLEELMIDTGYLVI
jgi:hypothetical protein